MKILFYWQIFKVQLNVLKSFFYTSKSLKFKYAHFLLCNTNRCIYLPVDHLWNQQDTTDQVFYGPVYYLGVNWQTISENAEPGSACRLCSAFISVCCQLYCSFVQAYFWHSLTQSIHIFGLVYYLSTSQNSSFYIRCYTYGKRSFVLF